MNSTIETLLLSAIIIILLALLYKYWFNTTTNIEHFDDISTLFDLETIECNDTPVWSNYIKNIINEQESKISFWNPPSTTDTTTYKNIGSTIITGYNNTSAKCSIIKIKNPSDAPAPVKFNKIFESGSNPLLTSNYSRNIYNQADYNYFLNGTDINYKTTTPITYTDFFNSLNYFRYNNNQSADMIYELDFAKTSVKQLTDEIAACDSTLKKNNEYLSSHFKNIYSQRYVQLINPSYYNNVIAYNINPNEELEVETLNPSVNYYNSIVIRVPKGVTVELYNKKKFQSLLFKVIVPLDVNIKVLRNTYHKNNYFQNGVYDEGDYVKFSGLKWPINSIKVYINNDTYSTLINRSDMDAKMKSHIDKLNAKLTAMNTFKNNIINGSVELPGFSCWEPVAPENYVAIGHVLYPSKGATSSDLDSIKTSISCISIHCYRKVRDWVASDIVYSYTSGGTIFQIYKNPFTNTFIGTVNPVGTANPKGPSGYIGKIITCPKKDYTIDNIIAFDGKIRENCKNYKNITNKSQLVSNDYNNDEDAYLQSSIYAKEKKIQELKAYANALELSNAKGTIVNQEYNRNQLATYIDKQRDRIDSALKQLEVGRNKIDVNLKYPSSVISQIIDYISNSAEIPIESKVEIIATLKQIQNDTLSSDESRKNIIAALTTCPQFDLTNYIKKDPPCFGCHISS
jgi:hypothetical protein